MGQIIGINYKYLHMPVFENAEKELCISDVLRSFYDYHWKRTDIVEKFYDYHWKNPIKIA